jgi:tetratricopeptide (TPR) repeat protein
MKKLFIPFYLLFLSCQNHTSSEISDTDIIIDTVKPNDTVIAKDTTQGTGGLKLTPIVVPRDSLKAIQYKDSALTLLINRGNLMDARYMAENAIYHNPHDADSWYICGNINQKLLRYDEALEAFHKAIEIKPNHLDAIKKAAILSSKKGDNNMACIYLWRACNMGDPDACEGVEKFCNTK